MTPRDANKPVHRYSQALRLLRHAGDEGAATLLTRMLASAHNASPQGFRCSTCRMRLDDPIVSTLGRRIVFACPNCSGHVMRARWEHALETGPRA